DQYIVRSNIPSDTSVMTLTVINSVPSSDPTKNYDSELVSVISTSGNGAFSDITYLILTDTKGGLPPPKSECGTTYPNGYIFSEEIFATILYYHPGTN
ncbi:35505_t:CDS:2, partial [Racocetra persica]